MLLHACGREVRRREGAFLRFIYCRLAFRSRRLKLTRPEGGKDDVVDETSLPAALGPAVYPAEAAAGKEARRNFGSSGFCSPKRSA